MNLRPFDAAAGDAARLSQFRCSTGAPFEDGVETWIRTDAVGCANDLPRAQFQAAYELTIDHLRTIERDGDHLAGLVHVDNHRSKRLLTACGWSSVAPWDDHELWVGSL